MIPAGYHDFFVAAAGAIAALTGLLFVALSVLPEQVRNAARQAEFQARATSALVLFTNGLTISLIALVPGSNGTAAILVGASGLAFVAATLRSLIAAIRRKETHWRSIFLALGFLGGFVAEIIAGVRLNARPDSPGSVQTLCYLVLVSTLAAIDRVWQLVGLRDTGFVSSILLLVRGDRAAVPPDPANPDPADPDPARDLQPAGTTGQSPAPGRTRDPEPPPHGGAPA